jgi:hypothetical protein
MSDFKAAFKAAQAQRGLAGKSAVSTSPVPPSATTCSTPWMHSYSRLYGLRPQAKQAKVRKLSEKEVRDSRQAQLAMSCCSLCRVHSSAEHVQWPILPALGPFSCLSAHVVARTANRTCRLQHQRHARTSTQRRATLGLRQAGPAWGAKARGPQRLQAARAYRLTFSTASLPNNTCEA